MCGRDWRWRLTGGMALEAINHAGHLPETPLLVVLNDNDMSISRRWVPCPTF